MLVAGLLALIMLPAACDARIVSVSACTWYGGTAIDENGSLWKWGYENVTAGNYAPYIVPGITGVKATDGNQYTLILKDDGTVWVMDTIPDLDADSEVRLTHIDLVRQIAGGAAVRLENISHASSIACNADRWIVLKDDGTVWTWNSTVMGLMQVGGLNDVKQIAMGIFGNYVAVKNDGTVWTWGSDTHGVLGWGQVNMINDNNTFMPTVLSPAQVPGLTDVKEVAAGMYFVAALKNDGTVWTWGSNDNGELGDGKSAAIEDVRPYPGQVIGLSDVVQISVGGGIGYALRSDGTVWKWRSVPTKVEGLTDIVQISTDGSYALALDENGIIYGWGRDDCGQLGNLEHGPEHYVNEPVEAPFSELLSGPSTEPSDSGNAMPTVTPVPEDTATTDDSILYMTLGNDGTIYTFTATDVIAYDSAGNWKWNLTIPGQWMHDKMREKRDPGDAGRRKLERRHSRTLGERSAYRDSSRRLSVPVHVAQRHRR